MVQEVQEKINKMRKMKNNNINSLWEELEDFFLKNDEDFQIIKIKDNSIIIKALNKYAFSVRYTYAKILAPIMPTNCKVKIKSSDFWADDTNNDFFKFNIKIKTKKNYYKGNIKIIRK